MNSRSNNTYNKSKIYTIKSIKPIRDTIFNVKYPRYYLGKDNQFYIEITHTKCG